MSDKIPCPVCGSKEIDEVIGSNSIDGPGYESLVKFEYCTDCGVHLYPKRKEQKK